MVRALAAGHPASPVDRVVIVDVRNARHKAIRVRHQVLAVFTEIERARCAIC